MRSFVQPRIAQPVLPVAPVAGVVSEVPAAVFAPVRRLLRVALHVPPQVPQSSKRSPAQLAGERLLSAVRPLVVDDVPPVIAGVRTEVALELPRWLVPTAAIRVPVGVPAEGDAHKAGVSITWLPMRWR